MANVKQAFLPLRDVGLLTPVKFPKLPHLVQNSILRSKRDFVILNIGSAKLRGMRYRVEGTIYHPVLYGGELHNWGAAERPCPGCGVEAVQQHRPGCEIEECPVCSKRLITCDHYNTLEEVED